MRKTIFLLPTIALLTFSFICSAADTPELAVIVNKSTTPAAINSAELRQLIIGEKPKWPDGKKVILLTTPADSPERVLMLKVVCKMNDASLKRYCMHAVFTGQEIVTPREVPNAAALKEIVARTPGAIGCIFATDLDDTVKPLKVDGAVPGESGYKLR